MKPQAVTFGLGLNEPPTRNTLVPSGMSIVRGTIEVFLIMLPRRAHLFRRNRCGLRRVERKRTRTDVGSGKHGSCGGGERQEVDLSANLPDTRV